MLLSSYVPDCSLSRGLGQSSHGSHAGEREAPPPRTAALWPERMAHAVRAVSLAVSSCLLKVLLLSGCQARPAANPQVPVLNRERKGEAGPGQRSGEGSPEAENRDGEAPVRVPQVSVKWLGQGDFRGSPHMACCSQRSPGPG